MKIAGDWINAAATQSVCRLLTAAGHQAYFVGGCVRDAVLGVPVGDIDIATDALPERVAALAEDAGLKHVPTGIAHGTVTVIAHGVPHEVTTFRKDVETDGRRAVVAYTDDLREDARRRDFTMNALYALPDGEVLDPLGGLADLRARRVRFIEDPAQRIREDYLRILRFFRFHAWYGDPAAGLDRDGLAAVADLADGLDGLSRERVGAEMLRLLAAPDPSPSVAAMRSAGVLRIVLPGSDDRFLAPLVHAESKTGADPDPVRRLAALGGEDPAGRLRLSKTQARKLATLTGAAAEPGSPGALGYRLGADMAIDVVILRSALLQCLPDPVQIAEARKGAAATFPVSAEDLMPRLSGPDLGRTLKELEDRWIASGFALSREELLR